MSNHIKKNNVVNSLDLPEHAKHPSHPFSNKDSHDRLLEHLITKLDIGVRVRDGRLKRMQKVDRQVAGWQRLGVEDQKREVDRARTGKQKPTQANIPLTFMHLDDLSTYFLNVFAPITGAYNLNGDKTQQKAGKGITKIMNDDAVYTGLVKELNRTFQSALKYNIAGTETSWEQEVGNVLTQVDDQLTTQRKIVWQGNQVTALDMYNTFWDPAADPLTLYKDGEYCVVVKKYPSYRIRKDTIDGRYRNTHSVFEKQTSNDANSELFERKYYIHPPTYVGLNAGNTGEDAATDWEAFFGTDGISEMHGVEVAHTYIWINPFEWKLKVKPVGMKKADAAALTILYRISIMEGKTIIETTEMNNVHRWLPFNFIIPNDDEMSTSQKSIGEIIDPFQVFVSFLYNVHTEGSRKALFGTTYYDPSMVDLDAIPEGEIAARIPVKPAARGRDIRTYISHDKGSDVNTQATMESVDRTMALLEQLIPTQASPNQVAGVDRAIKSQMHTLTQASNRRTQKTARVFDAQAFSPSRIMQYYNILQFRKEPVKLPDGSQISRNQLLELGLEFIIGHGLKALDKEIVADKVKEVMFMILQNQAASAEFNIPDLLTYLLELTEVKADLSQFKKEQPQQPQQPQTSGVPGDVNQPGSNATPPAAANNAGAGNQL